MPEYRSIELNVKIGCPVSCLYCPQDKFVKSNAQTKKMLSIENLQKILNNLTHNKKKAEVFFAGMSEPFSHANCVDLVECCELHPYITRIIIFTTGYHISDEKIEKLSKFKKLKINFHVGKKNNMPNFDQTIWNKLEKIKTNIKNYEFINVGFEKDIELENILKEKGISLKFQEIISRCGNLEVVGQQKIVKNFINQPVTCSKVNETKRPVILPDGTALACANDYSCELKIGNLIESIWEDLDFEKIKKIQKTPCDLPCFRGCHLAKRIQNQKLL